VVGGFLCEGNISSRRRHKERITHSSFLFKRLSEGDKKGGDREEEKRRVLSDHAQREGL